MTTVRWSSPTTIAVATLALALLAALVLRLGDAVGIRSAGAETVAVAAWLLGWTLLAWAAILAAVGGVQVIRRLVPRRGATLPEVALVAASIATTAVVITTHPLWGTGAGTG